jgi:hypothetical protein
MVGYAEGHLELYSLGSGSAHLFSFIIILSSARVLLRKEGNSVLLQGIQARTVEAALSAILSAPFRKVMWAEEVPRMYVTPWN